MLRSTATRPFIKGLVKVNSTTSSYNVAAVAARKFGVKAQLHSLSSKRPAAVIATPLRPVTVFMLRYATSSSKDNPVDKIDKTAEKKLASAKVEAHPELVSEDSSVRHVFESSQNDAQKDTDMMAGIKADLETVKDTFRLTDVPRESYYIGAAGLLPYIATSLSTVVLAYDINHAHTTGSGLIFSPETAHQLLSIIEPIQIGYGAVIISFLGAIHWGLEYAGYGGHHSYRRFAYGVIPPAIAWPTLLMPVESALITQFLAFNFMYFADARATVRGWCPPWYSTYRFVLTFFVGAAIVVSLIGRGQIIQHDARLPGPYDKMKALRDAQWENLEKEERERRKAMVEKDEEEESDDDGGDEKEDEGDDKGQDNEKNKKDNKEDEGKDKGKDNKKTKKDKKEDDD